MVESSRLWKTGLPFDVVPAKSGRYDRSAAPCWRFGIETLVRRIYKICPASAWREAERQGVFRGSPVDVSDGYIHLSTASQVAETARKHFAGQTGLFLIAVDVDALGNALRWERSRNDELFPHLYGELDLGAVTSVHSMGTRSDGSHEVPELET